MLVDSRADFLRNKSLAWVAVHRLKSVWRSTIRLDLKVLFFKTLVVPVFLSGAETWIVGTSLLPEITGAYTCLVRFVRGIKVYSRETRCSNNDLFADQFPRIEVELQRKRLRFAGHCLRADQPASSVLLATTRRKKKRGRPPLSYLDVLQRDLGMSNTEEIRELMADRVAWDAKVQRVVEATRQRTVRPPRKTRKGMKARGTGSGRPPEARDLAGCAAHAQG
ncbi:hypothetical protein DIPPA_20471 [Diplonema papillatum]|nr:hypothetical protein DIPPA_31746 [Diplonema papillatum]KAJ9468816.1 hypothetical protein DIPPA_20471 [Diplonema papillatum]